MKNFNDPQVPVKSQVAECFRFRDISILVSAFPTLTATVYDSSMENALEPHKKRDFSKTIIAFLILFARNDIKNIFEGDH
jgi:hypothetical protein